MQPFSHSAISVYCDGGSRGNPGPSACAFIVKDENGKTIHQEGKFLGTATNNLAEYQAVLLALNYLKKFIAIEPCNLPALPCKALQAGHLAIYFYLDSSLVVNQINGLFKVKNPKLREIIFQINSLISFISSRVQSSDQSPISFIYIPREKNFNADLLVNKILDEN